MEIDGQTHPLRFALVGAGVVGTSVSTLLKARGHSIAGVFSRSESSARRAHERTGAPILDSLEALPPVEAILVGVSDPHIQATASAIADSIDLEGVRLIHFAGAVGVSALEPAVRRGASAAALHPVQACPDIDTALARLPGSAWGVTTTPGEEEWGAALVSSMSGVPVRVAEEVRPLWHAAAVMTSNGIAALLALGESMLSAAGIERPELVLGPLASGAVANAAEKGGGGATLTGPVVRGDAGAIELHLATLRELAPELISSYVGTTRSILAAAGRAGRIDEATVETLRRLLDGVEPVVPA